MSDVQGTKELIAEADDLRGMPDGAIYGLVGDLRVALESAIRERDEALARIEAIKERLDVMVHPYAAKRIQKVTKRKSIRDLYGDEIIDDLEATPTPTFTENKKETDE